MTFRPALRPGALLLRRDAGHLQVGTSPGIVVADRPGLVPLLRLLDGVRGVGRLQEMVDAAVPELDAPVSAVLTELCALGVVVDASSIERATLRRAGHRVRIEATPGAGDLVRAMSALLTSSGVIHLTSTDPDLLVVVSYAEASRGRYEQASVLGLDHLPVVVDEDRVRVGPLVQPGRTPCLTCHDLHRADWDPAWPVLLHQMDGPLVRGPLGPLNALTTQAAALEATSEVLAHADGRATRTAGRCLVVGPGHDERTTWPVAFHHRCSCDLLHAA